MKQEYKYWTIAREGYGKIQVHEFCNGDCFWIQVSDCNGNCRVEYK